MLKIRISESGELELVCNGIPIPHDCLEGDTVGAFEVLRSIVDNLRGTSRDHFSSFTYNEQKGELIFFNRYFATEFPIYVNMPQDLVIALKESLSEFVKMVKCHVATLSL